MLTHSLSWPEITTLVSALGLVTTASISFCIALKNQPRTAKIPARNRF